MFPPFELTEWYDAAAGRLRNGKRVERHLVDLKGCFVDPKAYEVRLAQGNPLVYAVAGMEHPQGEGDLHYGLGILYPGKVGDEYFLTKGHLHSWRPAAEVYVGLLGQGKMLLEDEKTGESRLETLGKDSIVYVPGHTAHRTVNTGSEPLVYLGIYPSRAGHDYGAIAGKNFRMLVVDRQGVPTLVERPTS